ncbi:MAG: hypothetical protein U0Y68_11700 [Blastocatellia bacterium]
MKTLHWVIGFWFSAVALTLLPVSSPWAQTADKQTEKQDEKKEPPSEGFNDTLRRMAIKRAEEEHKKLVKSAQQAADIADTLNENSNGTKLDAKAAKKLHEIEKAAKQIRNNVGSDNGDKDFTPPKTLDEGIKRLAETSKLLKEQMEKTSRQMISAGVIVSANDMLRLIKVLREFL